MFFALYFCVVGCKRKDRIEEPNLEKSDVEIVEFHDAKSKPSVHVSNARPKQRKMIVDAYKQNIAYYKELETKDVQKIRFVGVDPPWKPKAERHYCIDAPERKQIEGGFEDVYYFANYCRSLSTIFREADKAFKSYIVFGNCTQVCECVGENHIDIPKKAGSCTRYCEDMGREQFCTIDASVEKMCCL